MPTTFAYIAMNRFTYGADAKSLQSLKNTSTLKEAQNWLIAQLTPYHLPPTEWTSEKAIAGNHLYQSQKNLAEKKQAQMQPVNAEQSMQSMNPMNDAKVTRQDLSESAKTLAQQTTLSHFKSEQALQSRLLDFFSNHFSVSRGNLLMTALAPTLEVEAIAPNLSNTFKQMLLAVSQHPAMLMYLNNERSIGPNSKQALRRKKSKKPRALGLNENLAREVLELHTLGVDAPYTQNDVIELAKALTGWSIGAPRRNEAPSFNFRAQTHEPGTRTVLGKAYKAPNSKPANQAKAILADLAVSQYTAKHISYKLAKHFIADNPSNDLVAAMSATWMKTNGHIPSVVTSMIKHPDSWLPNANKLKTPRDFVLSTCRACGVKKPAPNVYQTLEILGQGFFNAGSPAGYPDEQTSWLSTSGMNSRIEWANHFASLIAKKAKMNTPESIAKLALGPLLTKSTLQFIQRAESKQQALALLFMSPEFQRR